MLNEDYWADRPDTVNEEQHFQIMRTPPGGQMRGVITTDDYVGVNLHYYRGRSTPCRKNSCEACEAGHRPRWTGYVLLMSIKTRKVNIFEFTQRAWNAFNQVRAVKGSLRGVELIASRLGKRDNGPLTVVFEEARHDADMLPPAPELREILERIWEIKEVQLPLNLEGENRIAKYDASTSSNGKAKSKR